MENRSRFQITSAALHILAMVFMLCDHLWAVLIPGNDWLTCVGRLAFPIFAFLLVEGYFHTSNLKKYILRLLIFAVVSEIPFNLVIGSRFFYPVHQNVLWTLLIGLMLIHWIERTRQRRKLWVQFLVVCAALLLALILGIITFTDYYQAGILTVLVFYFFRGRSWWQLLCQLVCLWYLNAEVLSGFAYEFQLFGKTFFFMRQSFALLALIPIWLYRGKQGHHSKVFQYVCYSFYPLHLLLLVAIRFFFLR